MKLSVIIVNYNVSYFLEQCLNSVYNSVIDFEMEVFVVDNNSVDDSNLMVKTKFPKVLLIENKQNLGFSKANNQALKIARGRYCLLLNPDTIVESDTFQKVCDFMDENPRAGGLGVKMLDGKGNFLPESKRGLPTPSAAFYKIFGISKLFPRSKKFASYHAGHLDKDEVSEIEILSGAFMLMRAEALEKTGFLDEDFFMYGEDIDLSFRIIKAGFKNFYFPKTRIIHYKGESTKKDSVNYVFVFYNAMIIFARKHFSQQNAKMFSFLINMAIIFKASMTIVANFIKSLYLPILDFLMIYGGLWAFAKYYGTHFASQTETYPPLFLYGLLPLLVFLSFLTTYYSGGYEKSIKFWKIIRGQMIGWLLVLVVYALLPENLRFSRALIIAGIIWSPFVLIAVRLLFFALKIKGFEIGNSVKKRLLLVGSVEESARVKEIVVNANLNVEEIKFLDPTSSENVEQKLPEMVKVYKINELIFCAKDLSAANIIDLMTSVQGPNIDFKIAPPETMFIIGSNSINTAGDIYMQTVNTIDREENKRFKRLFDIMISILLVIAFPFSFAIFKSPLKFGLNIVKVLFAKKSIVGFDTDIEGENLHLPKLRKGVLHPSDAIAGASKTDENIKRVNLVYAREYKVLNDFNIFVRGFRKMDRI